MKYRYKFSGNSTSSQGTIVVEVLANNYRQAKIEVYSALSTDEVWRVRLYSVVPNE